MMDRVLLNVPYAEKDQAKSRGARWDPVIRQWYVPAGVELEHFAQWLPDSVNDAGLLAKAPIYLVESSERCWKCGQIANVFCLASEGMIEDGTAYEMFFIYSQLAAAPRAMQAILKAHAPSYYLDYTMTSDSTYYVNHCPCGAKLGDFFLHNEPEGAFSPVTFDQAQCVTLHLLENFGDIEIDANWSVQDEDLVYRFAARAKLQLGI